MDQKRIYLGVNSSSKKCCVVYTDGIISRMEATNWCGCDDIDRTLYLKNLKLTGSVMKYAGRYCGIDYDCGHQHVFTFDFDELWEANKTKV